MGLSNRAVPSRGRAILPSARAIQTRGRVILHPARAVQTRERVILRPARAVQTRGRVILHPVRAVQTRGRVILHPARAVQSRPSHSTISYKRKRNPEIISTYSNSLNQSNTKRIEQHIAHLQEINRSLKRTKVSIPRTPPHRIQRQS